MESRKSESQSERAHVARSHHFFKRAIAAGCVAAVLFAAAAARAGNAPVIVQQPFAQTVATGSDVLLEAGVSGDAPLTYTWLFKGTNLPTGTNSTLFLPAVQTANAGNYQLVVSNASGTATSAVTSVLISPQAQVAWSSHFPGGSVLDDIRVFNYTPRVAADASGNIYVAGSAIISPATNHVFQVAKLSVTGQILWLARYAGTGGENHLTDMILDSGGNVYVTGSSADTNGIPDFATVKIDPSGVQVWAQRYGDPTSVYNFPTRLGMDSTGNIYVCGTTYYPNPFGLASYYTVVKYSAPGGQLWQVGPGLNVQGGTSDMAVDAGGNVFVTGIPATIKLDASGNLVWAVPVNGSVLKQDSSGNSYVMGFNSPTPLVPFPYQWPSHYEIVKLGSFGNPLWTNTYAGPGFMGAGQVDFALGSDGSGVVTGKCFQDQNDQFSQNNFLTVKFATGGQKLWAARFVAGSTNEISEANRITMDGDGNAYVTGISFVGGTNNGGFGQALTTIKYDPNGNEVWTAEYLNTNGYSWNSAVTLDAANNVIIAGFYNKPDFSRDFVAVKYGQSAAAGAPVITQPPQTQNVLVGTNVILSVNALGGPFTYQWLRAATNIPGATHATLTLNDIQPADGDDYSVMVQNAVDTTASPAARVGLLPQLSSPIGSPAGEFSFTLTGDVGVYDIQTSLDLLEWTDDATIVNGNGATNLTTFSFDPQKFYRAKKLN